MKQSFFLLRLSACNLKGKVFRTVCLVIVVAILGMSSFGGSILTASLSNGMSSMENRLGADLMIVPKGYEGKTEGILLKGEPNYFYLDQSLVQKIEQVEGVSQVSSQFFLTSLSTECCTLAVQLIGFNPYSDFVIQPWISKTYSQAIGDGQIIVGSDIQPEKDNTLILFGTTYPVVAKLEKTATGLDSAVFMNMNTMQQLFLEAKKGGLNFLLDQDPTKSVSAILVKIERDFDARIVAHNIYSSISDIEVIVPKTMIHSISNNLNSLIVYIRTLTYILWFLAIVVLAIVFSVTINERKKEFAVFRILGATRSKLSCLVLIESLSISLIGGIIGILIGALVVFPFGEYIEFKLQLPYIYPDIKVIIQFLSISLLLTLLVGPLTSIYSAIKIGRSETYITMREGE